MAEHFQIAVDGGRRSFGSRCGWLRAVGIRLSASQPIPQTVPLKPLDVEGRHLINPSVSDAR
jgi:hypothetical protein